jgi:hypothetical protein
MVTIRGHKIFTDILEYKLIFTEVEVNGKRKAISPNKNVKQRNVDRQAL